MGLVHAMQSNGPLHQVWCFHGSKKAYPINPPNYTEPGFDRSL